MLISLINIQNQVIQNDGEHAIAEILLSAAHKNFSWNQTTKSVNKVSLYCSVDLGKHTKLVWLWLPNSHCATKSLVTALQMSDVHFKSQTSTVQCFRFTEIVCTLLFSFYLWRQVEIKISKMIWLCQAARAAKPVFCLLTKRAMFTPHRPLSRFQIGKVVTATKMQWRVDTSSL